MIYNFKGHKINISDDLLNKFKEEMNNTSQEMLDTCAHLALLKYNDITDDDMFKKRIEDATYVAGFNTWKNSFHRNVKKGEKGIRILAPAPIKKKDTEEITDENGNTKTQEVEKVLRFFKPAYVFDISQTEGEPLKEIRLRC